MPGLGDTIPLLLLQYPRHGALIQFNNTFNIHGGGGGGAGGIDMRRTVTMIADHLEEEMNNRMRGRTDGLPLRDQEPVPTNATDPNAYGWTTAPQYNRADVPTG